MILISIDGASRRNGKPDCMSAAGIVCANYDEPNITHTSIAEYGSTNQRAELHALCKALQMAAGKGDDIMILTDSEYVFNGMTRRWYNTWRHNNWLTSSGEPVKNRDIWESVVEAVQACGDITYYHIKGHCIPFGTVRARNAMNIGFSCLVDEVFQQYDSLVHKKADVLQAAQELSERNNGFTLTSDQLRRFVAFNTLADIVATLAVEQADSAREV